MSSLSRIHKKNKLSIELSLCHKAVWMLIAICWVSCVTGCGAKNEWPSSQGDYLRVEADRGLAMQWGVVFDLEKAGEETATTEQSGTLGVTPEESNAEKEIRLGNVRIVLKADGQKDLELSINDQSYGRVRIGNQVKITPEREIYVNNELRKSK